MHDKNDKGHEEAIAKIRTTLQGAPKKVLPCAGENVHFVKSVRAFPERMTDSHGSVI